MAYDVVLYVNSSAPEYMTKTLSTGVTVSCNFKAPIDVENPTIYIAGGAAYADYNYAYIAEFGRYYFIKPVGGTSQTVTYECKSDPLMSFKDQILACPAVIARNPWHWDMYIPDSRLPVEARTVSAILNFPNANETSGPFDGTHNCYVLTTLGG